MPDDIWSAPPDHASVPQLPIEADNTDASTPHSQSVARIAQIARCPARQQDFASVPHGLTERLQPAALALLDLIEDDTLPDRACEQLGTALLILADVAEDDELGLIGATPEQVSAAQPERFEVPPSEAAQFDSALFTPYVRSIYVSEIEAVRLATGDRRKSQLARSARTLAQIVAAGALPLDHVRQSLLEAAAPLPAVEALSVIEEAVDAGLRQPRKLPAARPRP